MSAILVSGATGKQGGAVVQSLIRYNDAHPSNTFGILALTRNATSDKAKALSTQPNVTVVQGDLDDTSSIETIFSTHKPYGVFSVQDNFAADEAQQGIVLADLAVKHGVKRFVYSGVDLSGMEQTPVAYFESKRKIENHIHTLPPSTSWTILRPSAFYEAFYWPGMAEMMLATFKEDTVLSLVTVSDIGQSAAHVFTTSESDYARYRGQSIEVTGDRLTIGEIVKILEQEKGEKHVKADNVEVSDFVRNLLLHLENNPYLGTAEATKEYFPFFRSFREWVKVEYKP